MFFVYMAKLVLSVSDYRAVPHFLQPSVNPQPGCAIGSGDTSLSCFSCQVAFGCLDWPFF